MTGESLNRSGTLSSGSIKTGLVQVIEDFSDYLLSQKQNANFFVDISAESYAHIKNWNNKTPNTNAPNNQTSNNQEPDNKAPDNRNLPEASFFFQGSETADIFILDSENGLFKGDSGGLLKKILGAMQLAPEAVFICNAHDMAAVHQKIKTVSPKIIITLGPLAGQALLKLEQPLEQFRSKFHHYHGIRVMPTFHPSLLLAQPQYKRQVWEDMKQVMEAFGLGHGS